MSNINSESSVFNCCNQGQWLLTYYIFLPPVTLIVSPLTYENSGLATAKTALAASAGLPGLLSGMSAYASLFFLPSPFSLPLWLC